MKRTNTIRAAAILCIVHCALCINISCTSDEQASGDNLPDGKYPLELIATAISVAQSRATTDGTWSGSETIGLIVNGDDNVYQYTADTNGKLTSTTPYYWKSKSDIEVTAWYPLSASTNGSTFSNNIYSDQSSDDDYTASDLIVASGQTITFAGNKTLTFYHKMAKIIVKADISKLPSTATLTGAKLKGVSEVMDNATSITMHQQADNIYEAIVVPQTLTDSYTKALLTIDGISTYAYSFPTNTSWEANNSYTYNLTISGNELTLTDCTIKPWSEEVAEEGKTINPASKEAIINATYTTVDVSTLSSNAVVPDKSILTGTNTNGITIAAGASVAFKDLTVETTSTSAIKCLGNANVYLMGTNTAQTTKIDCCGIEIGGEGTTLTIDGSGSIEVKAGKWAAGIGNGTDWTTIGNITINSGTVTAIGGWAAAGIGSGDETSFCGDITINGGTVTATGGYGAAGIGSGDNKSSCGNITINGGTVKANGGEYAAGIGSGYSYTSCNDIIIKGTVTHVTATKGTDAPNSIGAGIYSTCGTIKIEDDTKVTQN